MSNRHPLKVGLTGGIGSGKSAAASLFAALGVDIVDSDVVARQVVEPGEVALDEIALRFGSEILLASGELNRRALREIIFNDPEQKRWLEALLHPLIRARTVQALDSSSSAYVILVSPLLFESGQDALVDTVVVVDVDEAHQLDRTSARDEVDARQVRSIMATQLAAEARRARADYLIDNRGGLDALESQVASLHRKLLALAQMREKGAE